MAMGDRSRWGDPEGGIVAYAIHDLPSSCPVDWCAGVRWPGFVPGDDPRAVGAAEYAVRFGE